MVGFSLYSLTSENKQTFFKEYNDKNIHTYTYIQVTMIKLYNDDRVCNTSNMRNDHREDGEDK